MLKKWMYEECCCADTAADDLDDDDHDDDEHDDDDHDDDDDDDVDDVDDDDDDNDNDEWIYEFIYFLYFIQSCTNYSYIYFQNPF